MKASILYAPDWYWLLPQEEREKGRCGAGEGLGEKLVPETIYFLSIRGACQIHDKMYWKGKTSKDKQEADRVFLNNILRIIDANTSNSLLKWLRRRRAYKYYEAVANFGGAAFWKDKNKPEEWGIA
jgi:hypothetical protein